MSYRRIFASSKISRAGSNRIIRLSAASWRLKISTKNPIINQALTAVEQMRTIFLLFLFLSSATLSAQDPADRLRKAREDLAADRYPQAAAAYEELCPQVKTSSCWNELGVAQMSLGGYTRALDSFRRAHTIAPDSGLILSHLALASFAARRRDLAGEYHRKALERAPNNADVRVNYGIYLYMARNYTEAEQEFRRVLRADTGHFFARLQLARVHFAIGQNAEALRELDEAIAVRDDFFDLYYLRAQVKYRSGDMGGALADLNRAEKLSPLNGRTGPLRKQIKRKMNRI